MVHREEEIQSVGQGGEYGATKKANGVHVVALYCCTCQCNEIIYF